MIYAKYTCKALAWTIILAMPFTPALGDFAINWATIDSGGQMWTTGDHYELSGTIGQHDAGTLMSGGTFQLSGGFWPGAVEEPFCLGDLDYDGFVNLSDLAQLLGSYGTTSGAVYEDGDLDGDGDVDLSDLAELLSVYGTIC